MTREEKSAKDEKMDFGVKFEKQIFWQENCVRYQIATVKKIQNLVKHQETKKYTSDAKSVVYEIPCKGCQRTYVGETGREAEVRLKEHRSDVKFHEHRTQ